MCQATAGRKGGTSLLSCHGLGIFVSHCEPGAVVSCESHGVICSKSRAFCPALCAITYTLLLVLLMRKKAIFSLVCGCRKPWGYLNVLCSPSKVCITHFPCFPMWKAEPCNDSCLPCETCLSTACRQESSMVKVYWEGQRIINISSGCSRSAQDEPVQMTGRDSYYLKTLL